MGILMRPQKWCRLRCTGFKLQLLQTVWEFSWIYMAINMCLTINSLTTWSFCFCSGYLTMISQNICPIKYFGVSVSLSVFPLSSMFNLSLMLFHTVNIMPSPHSCPSSLIFKCIVAQCLFSYSSRFWVLL